MVACDSMKSKRPRLSLNEEKRFLLKLAERIERAACDQKRAARRQAAIDASTLRMLARRCDFRSWSETQLRQFDAGLLYTLRFELAGKRNGRRIRGEVAQLCGFKDQTVSNAAARYKREIAGWLARLGRTDMVERISWREMLEYEAKSIEDCYSGGE